VTIVRRILPIALLVLAVSPARAQLVVDNTYTGQQLADLIVADGVVVTNVVLTCPTGGSGFFDGTASNIGLPSGVLLTSGLAQQAIGPNSSNGVGGACNGAPGDPAVEAVAGTSTFDACILEFDIVPTCSQVSFQFVFGSEEYPENIGNEFSDAMAITISGPGFVGNQNIALVPGTATPIRVGTVNQSQNNAYYVNNGGGASIQFDGFTVPITATANVTSCESYHIKLAVADAADCIFNSGLFIEENSFDCGVDIAIVTQFTAPADQPIEGCRSYEVEFCRQGSTALPYALNITTAGTAINGVDFVALPNTVAFAAGEQCQTLTIEPIADGLVEGPETLYLIYEAISGNCTVFDTIHITLLDDQGLIPDFYFNDVCDGNTVFFNNATTITPPAAATDFYWRLGDGTETPNYNTSHLYAAPGTYDVWLRAASSDGCVDSIMQQVTVYDYPEASFTLSGDVCLSVPALFTNTSTGSTNDAMGAVSWNFGDGISANTMDATHIYSLPDTFPVVLTISNATLGCTDEYRDTIVVYSAIFTDFIFSNVCLGNTVNFINQSQGVGTYEWDFGDGSPFDTNFNVSHDYAVADTFDVRLVGISPNGCNDTTVKQVFVFDAPLPDFTAPNVCANELAQYTNNSLPPSMGTLASWFWIFSDGTSASAFSPAHAYPAPGNYDATLIVYSSNLSCSDTITRPITIYPVPDADFTVANTCFGNPIAPVNLTTGQVSQYSWDFGNGSPENTQQNPVYNYPNSGFYDIWLHVTSANLCADSMKQTVIVYSLPQAQFTSTVVCEGTPTTFFNQSGIGFPDNIIQWTWDYGDGSPVDNTVNPEHEYADGGIYQVELKVTSGNGCLDSVTAPVEVYFAPDAEMIVTVTEGCPPLCTQFFDASTIGSGGIVEWTWNFGNLQTSTDRNAQHCYFGEEIFESTFYDVSLRTVSDNGCVTLLVMDDLIEIYPTPYADFTWDPDSVSMFDPRVFFQDGSYGADYWTWEFGDPLNSATSSLQNPVYEFGQQGEYSIILTAANDFGCQDSTLKKLTVYSDFRFYIPNSFTPNSDDRNEKFFGKGAGIMTYNMQVYDRWGKLVFESNDPEYQWDGTTGGKVSPQGMYVYRFNVRDMNSNWHQYTGEVYLIR
jgi:gliding motility-associated-like protein